MLDKFTRDDLCIGMRVTTRDGMECVVDIGLLGNLLLTEDEKAICDISNVYTNDLYYGNGDEEHDLDIMRVMLPSGVVLWERQEVELRVFDFELYKKDCPDWQDWTWWRRCADKLCSFPSRFSEDGLVDGFIISRAWTRALTDEERKTWGKRK